MHACCAIILSKNRIVSTAAGEKKVKRMHKEKEHHSVPCLLWTGWSMFSFVEVSGYMSPRLHSSLVLCPIYLFILWPDHKHALVRAHRWVYIGIVVGCRCRGVQVGVNLRLFVLKSVPWIMVRGLCWRWEQGARWGWGIDWGCELGGWRGGTKEKWSPSCQGSGLGWLKEIFMSYI